MATKNLLPDLLPTKAILSPDDKESTISSKLSISITGFRSPETITSVIMSPRIILPAAAGKIMRGDIITDVIVSGDRKPVIDIDSFEEIVDSLSSGDKIALVGRRSGNRFFVAITVD